MFPDAFFKSKAKFYTSKLKCEDFLLHKVLLVLEFFFGGYTHHFLEVLEVLCTI